MSQSLPRRLTSIRRDSFFVKEYQEPHKSPLKDAYHQLLSMSWPAFLTLLVGVYLGISFVFALLYAMIPGGISNSSGTLDECFFFAIQTMSTVGYGGLAPQTPAAHWLMVTQSIIGFLLTAVSTGLMFAKFSRVQAEVLFSHPALIHIYDGQPVLTFRAANKRNTQIVDAQLNVTLAYNDTTREGIPVRRLYDLELQRQRSPLFSLVWNVYHDITPESPLYGLNKKDLVDRNVSILVTLYGIDDSLGTILHTRHAYDAEQIFFHQRFANIIELKPNGERIIDYQYFHDKVDQELPLPWENKESH